MGRVRILSDTVANKIAAGEVVERPASVLKELLENSLDAGATEIRIDIESGGRRLIRLADNGCGMLRDDALLAFERHATSKLNDVDDLLSIATLGFRGEALPSIASVSRLMLETRSAEESTGTTIEIAGGKLLRCDESALSCGTVVTVRDLFFNVPARRKFLRTEQTELAHVASLATHYSLAHPSRSFELRNGANELLGVTPVSSLRERVYQVFGAQTLEDLVEIGYSEREIQTDVSSAGEEPGSRVFALRGFVSRPQVQKLNRNSVFLFVNGRLIRDRLLLHALTAAYHNLMPPACYPFALLFLDCDCEEVDVNVHPSKTEVRFRHGSFVHDFVRDSLREVLMRSRPVSSIPMPAQPQPAAELPYSEFSQAMENARLMDEPASASAAAASTEDLPVLTLKAPASPPPRFDFGTAAVRVEESRPSRLTIPDTHGSFPPGALEEPSHSLSALGDLHPLGQIHESFIIAAGRDGLWIIDQHVAHERILFEQVLKQRASGRVEMQQLLMPILLELTPAQQLQYARIADELNQTGFETEPFGTRTIAVKSAPAGVGGGEIEKLIFEVLEIGESELRGLSLDDLRRAIAASVACRAAIKINTRLDQSKMEWLITALAATDYPMSCPHGRPIALRYSMKDILKGFHRI
ncbi:MAG: DNA mismatch repair endonuclease MutL [Bryobacteraceae bacterium]